MDLSSILFFKSFWEKLSVKPCGCTHIQRVLARLCRCSC